MSSRPARRRPAALLALLLASLTVPVTAQAADAPLRAIGFAPDGKPAELFPVGVSNDGKLVVGTQVRGNEVFSVVRDVAAGTTKDLRPAGQYLDGASADLATLLVTTGQALVPSDTNGADDLYLVDRVSGKATLATTAAIGIANTPATVVGPGSYYRYLAPGGKVALIPIERLDLRPGAGPSVRELWRFDAATGVAGKLPARTPYELQGLDDAARVVPLTTGIWVNGRLVAYPAGTFAGGQAAVSRDGSAVAIARYSSTSQDPKIFVVNTATGVSRTVTVPSSLAKDGFDLVAPADGGGDTVLITWRQAKPAGLRQLYGTLHRNGAIVQVGPDVPVTADLRVITRAAGGQFAATGAHLAKLGSLPLPGNEPTPPPSSTSALTYVAHQEPYCEIGAWLQTVYYRDRLTLLAGARGTDLRTPAKADFTVTMDSGAVANVFSLTPGQTRQLTTGVNGGFTYQVKVTFTDGTSVEGARQVATHPRPRCTLF